MAEMEIASLATFHLGGVGDVSDQVTSGDLSSNDLRWYGLQCLGTPEVIFAYYQTEIISRRSISGPYAPRGGGCVEGSILLPKILTFHPIVIGRKSKEHLDKSQELQ